MDWTLQGRIYLHYLSFSLPQVTQLARDILGMNWQHGHRNTGTKSASKITRSMVCAL